MTDTVQAVTAKDVERALLHRYMGEQNGWAALREVYVTDGEACQRYRRARRLSSRLSRLQMRNKREGVEPRNSARLAREYREAAAAPQVRYIDLLLIRVSSGQKVPHERIAIEIKVARSDFLRDDATKRRAWERAAHRFAYATPPDLVSRDEVPAHCGLLYVSPRRFEGRSDVWPKQQVWWAKHAPRLKHEPEPFGDRWVAYLAGRAARAEWTRG